MDNNEYSNVLACCKKYGFAFVSCFSSLFPFTNPIQSPMDCLAFFSDKDPNLWVLVLSYFAEKDDDCQKEISEILNNILFIPFFFCSSPFHFFFLPLLLANFLNSSCSHLLTRKI